MANLIKLPTREGQIDYDDETIADWLASLADGKRGEAVIVDEPQDTESKARNRAKLAADRIAETVTGLKARTHSVEDEDGNYVPAVSLGVKDRTENLEVLSAYLSDDDDETDDDENDAGE